MSYFSTQYDSGPTRRPDATDVHLGDDPFLTGRAGTTPATLPPNDSQDLGEDPFLSKHAGTSPSTLPGRGFQAQSEQRGHEPVNDPFLTHDSPAGRPPPQPPQPPPVFETDIRSDPFLAESVPPSLPPEPQADVERDPLLVPRYAHRSPADVPNQLVEDPFMAQVARASQGRPRVVEGNPLMTRGHGTPGYRTASDPLLTQVARASQGRPRVVEGNPLMTRGHGTPGYRTSSDPLLTQSAQAPQSRPRDVHGNPLMTHGPGTGFNISTDPLLTQESAPNRRAVDVGSNALLSSPNFPDRSRDGLLLNPFLAQYAATSRRPEDVGSNPLLQETNFQDRPRDSMLFDPYLIEALPPSRRDACEVGADPLLRSPRFEERPRDNVPNDPLLIPESAVPKPSRNTGENPLTIDFPGQHRPTENVIEDTVLLAAKDPATDRPTACLKNDELFQQDPQTEKRALEALWHDNFLLEDPPTRQRTVRWRSTHDVLEDNLLLTLPEGVYAPNGMKDYRGVRLAEDVSLDLLLRNPRPTPPVDVEPQGLCIRNKQSFGRGVRGIDRDCRRCCTAAGVDIDSTLEHTPLDIIFGALLVYIAVLVLLLVIRHKYLLLTKLLLFFLFGVLILIVALWYIRQRKYHIRKLKIGVLFLIAAFVGLIFGLTAWNDSARQLWWLNTGRTSVGNSADTPALKNSDAAVVHFSGNSTSTSVDPLRSAGVRDGDMYCAAPVLDDSRDSNGLMMVNYWVVGIDCCGEIGSFVCDASRRVRQAYGVVMLERGYPCPGCNAEYFEAAVHKAEAAHRLVSAPNAVYMRWVENPRGVHRHLMNRTLFICIVGALILLLILFPVGWTLQRYAERIDEWMVKATQTVEDVLEEHYTRLREAQSEPLSKAEQDRVEEVMREIETEKTFDDWPIFG